MAFGDGWRGARATLQATFLSCFQMPAFLPPVVLLVLVQITIIFLSPLEKSNFPKLKPIKLLTISSLAFGEDSQPWKSDSLLQDCFALPVLCSVLSVRCSSLASP